MLIGRSWHVLFWLVRARNTGFWTNQQTSGSWMWLPKRLEKPIFFRGKVCLESEILKGALSRYSGWSRLYNVESCLDNYKEILIISWITVKRFNGCSILYKEWTRLTWAMANGKLKYSRYIFEDKESWHSFLSPNNNHTCYLKIIRNCTWSHKFFVFSTCYVREVFGSSRWRTFFT